MSIWEKVKGFFHYDAWIMLLDILATNVAYWGALIIRFYINGRYIESVGTYMEKFYDWTPWYTVATIVVFCLFRLYGGLWIYAGLNDMNRIIWANVVSVAIQVVGSLLVVGRMPITYYLIGAFLQLFFIIVIRFSYRFLSLEKDKISRKKTGTIPALVVGSGDYGQKVIRHLENNTPFKTVVIAGENSGRNMDGIPVVPVSAIAYYIKDKDIKAVFIADKELDREQRAEIIIASEGLEMKDYTGQLSNQTGSMPVTTLLELIEGPLTVAIDGEEKKYASSREVLDILTQQYDVKSIKADKIILEKTETDESWIQGEELSFF